MSAPVAADQLAFRAEGIDVGPRSRSVARVGVLALLPLIAGVAVVLGGAWILRDTFWGDPTIYLVYARNAAAGHPFQFNVGEFSSGVASALWSLVLAVPFVFGLGVTGAKVWTAMWAVAGVLSTAWATGRLSGSSFAGAVAALVLVPTMAFFGVMTYDSGMTVTLVALSLVARGRPLAFLWALLLFSRPETAILVGLEVLALGWRRYLPLAIVAALPSGLYYGYSQIALGSYSVSNATRTIDQGELATRIGSVAVSAPAIVYILTLLPLVAVAAFGLWREKRHRLLVGGGLAAFGVLLVVYPVTLFVERYALTALPLLALGIALTIARLPLIAIVVAALVAMSAATWNQEAQASSARGYTFDAITERALVAELNEIAPANSAVLGYEVQDRWWLRPDLRYLAVNGLTDGLITPWRERGDVTGYLEAYRPALWIANDQAFAGAYYRGTVLAAAYELLASGSDHVSIDGITFDIAWRNPEAVPGFAGAPLLVRLSYR